MSIHFSTQPQPHRGRSAPTTGSTARAFSGSPLLIALLLAGQQASGATFELVDPSGENVLLEFSPAEYLAFGQTFEFKAGRENILTREESAEFVDAFITEDATAAEVFVGAPGIPRFARPFNDAPNGFASGRAAPDGMLEVGVSGNLGLPGQLEAVASYSYSIAPRSASDARLRLFYTIPALELKLQGTTDQAGPVPLPIHFPGTPDLQYAEVNSTLIYKITDELGNLVKSDVAYNYGMRLAKHSVFPGLEDQLGFDFSETDDLRDAVLDGITSDTVSIEEDFSGPLDLATWSYDEIVEFTNFPKIAVGHTLHLIFSSSAYVISPLDVIEVGGGEARIGDPFLPLTGVPAFSWSLVPDDPVLPAAVPVPASVLLLAGGIGGLSCLARRRKRQHTSGA